MTYQVETAFDQIVGAIEDIVIDDRFQDLQTELLEKHFHHFDVSIQDVFLMKWKHIAIDVCIKIIFSSSSELRGEQVDLHGHFQRIHCWDWEIYWGSLGSGKFERNCAILTDD